MTLLVGDLDGAWGEPLVVLKLPLELAFVLVKVIDLPGIA
jgi:hypothetical protein